MRLRIIPSACVVLALTLIAVFVTGCGSREVNPAQVADAQSADDRALLAYEPADFSAALTDLTTAIETPVPASLSFRVCGHHNAFGWREDLTEG